MLAVTHATIGAISGIYIEKPELTFILNMLIHLPFDKVPHYLPANAKKVNLLAAVDILLTLLLFGLIWTYGGENRVSMAAGAMGGVIIDFLLVLTPLIKTRLGEWHIKRQAHRPSSLNCRLDFTILAMLVIIWWLLK